MDNLTLKCAFLFLKIQIWKPPGVAQKLNESKISWKIYADKDYLLAL